MLQTQLSLKVCHSLKYQTRHRGKRPHSCCKLLIWSGRRTTMAQIIQMTNQISLKRCLKSVNNMQDWCGVFFLGFPPSWTSRGEKKKAEPISFLTVSYHSLSSHVPADCLVLAWWIIWKESRSLVRWENRAGRRWRGVLRGLGGDGSADSEEDQRKSGLMWYKLEVCWSWPDSTVSQLMFRALSCKTDMQ